MEIRTIADALLEGCRAGRESENLEKLYAPDAVSVEAMDMPGVAGRSVTGLEAIRAKHAWWNASVEVHGGSVSDPMYHGDDRFAVIFEVECTMRDTGARSDMREVAIYTVGEGRIIREEFFSAP